jgi:hypothetical protein
MVTMSLGRMLWGRLKGHQANRRALQRTAQIAVLSQTENLEPRLLMTADPDDQIQDAIRLGTITTPVTRNDSVNVAIDVDMYRVDVTAGTRLSFDIDRPSTSRLDSLIRLFNASGQELAFNDDAAAPGEVRGLDSFLEYTFATAGSYYLGVSGFGNRNYNAITGLGDTNGTTGSYALVVTNTTPPDLDDQISEAIDLGEIDRTVTRTGAIDAPTDVDMYRITVNTARRVEIEIDRPSGSSLDSYLRVFDANGNEVARNDDGPTPGEANSLESFLALNLNAGTYFIAVSGFGNSGFNPLTGTGDTSGSTGNYSLSVTPDTDDQIYQAIDLGEIDRTVTRTGTIDVPTDVDMYRITVNTARRVEIEIDRPSGNLDSYLRVFDANGNEVARNDDGPTPGEGSSVESFLALNLNAGTYFIAVSGFGNSSFNALTGDGDTAGSTGNYSLSVTPDVDDQTYQAIDLGAISGTVTRTESIDVGSDVDMYRFTVATAGRVQIDIDRPSGSLDSYLRVFDANGNEVARNDDGPTPGEANTVESYLDLNLSAGTYFIGISGFGNSSYNALTGDGDTFGSIGNYSLNVTLVATANSDPDDQISEAIDLGVLSGTVSRTGAIDVGTDVDMYRFTLTTAGRVQIDIDRPSGNLDSYLRVFDANGNEVARNDDGPTPGEAGSLESYLDLNLNAGTYFIGISGFGNGSYNPVGGGGDTTGSIGNYSLNVTLVATANSDPDDQISEAIDLGVLSGTVSRTGAIDVGTDVDMYRFTLTTAGRVQIDIDRPSGNLDSYLRVFDANGNEVARNDDGPTPGEAGSLESYLDLNLSAGTYFIGISGFGNSSYNAVSGGGDLTGSTGQFSLEVSLANVDPPPPPPPPGSGNRILYLNFDGANISRTDLVRWAGNDWADSVNEFDSDQNGINVQAFLSSRGDREQIISQMLTMIQIDLNPFGITVVRSTAAVVENEGATTIFLGRSTLSNGYYHVADDIDFGNDNRTDIAFVGDEDWGTASNTAIAMSDVALHEAGHTFGLYHVQSGTAPESMGLRYSTPQSQWVTDTRFVDQAFNELPGHGGGRGPQNSYQTMLRTFPANGSSPSGNNGANPLTAQEVRNILRAGYGEGPHNLPIQEGFAPDGAYDDHDHHVQVAGRSEAITVANRQDATRLSAEIAADSVGSVATANQAERVALIASSQTGESATQLNTHDVDDHVTSSNHAEFANQFQSAAWNSLLEGLQSLA